MAAATMYATAAGAGLKDGTDWDNAFATAEWLTDYTTNAEAGDIYYMKAATFTPAGAITSARDGTAIAPIRTIGVKAATTNEPPVASDWGVEGDRPLIACGANDFSSDNYTEFFYIEVTITTAAGWKADTAARFEGCKAENLSSSANRPAIQLGGTGGRVADCECASLNGIAVSMPSSGCCGEGCHLRDSNVGVDMRNLGVVVESCLFNTCETYGAFVSRDAEFLKGNTFYNCGAAVHHDAQHGGVVTTNNILANNTVGLNQVTGAVVGNTNDWNVFHDNGSDTTNVTKGPNSATADPAFAGENTWSDLASTAASNIVTSSAGGFSTYFAANALLHIESGTNWTAGWYNIVSVDSDNQVTLSADPTTGGNGSVGVARACNDFTPGTFTAGFPGTFPGTLDGTEGEKQIGAVQRTAGGGSGLLATSAIGGALQQ